MTHFAGGGGPLGGSETYVNQFPRCDLRRTSGVDADVALLRRFSPSADMCALSFSPSLRLSPSLCLVLSDDLSVMIVWECQEGFEGGCNAGQSSTVSTSQIALYLLL